ncbi:molybdopterin converting factor [Lysobacter sp. TY2-98]|uniref:MoaD/ThiS family protein n=1 Tax=Lysobacter sp. TY2-98 TaxID=2290922 RepID=UPI000E2017C9|nr:MoaD/ThiS family protein [Lysobacter sp. TY2-98]AXK71496.1 molybdopterin converting factor [Lysobacter sp. TY2-98]
MTTVHIELFGALREVVPGARIHTTTEARTVGELRAQIDAESAGWPAQARALLSRSAFASTTTVLRDSDPLPDDGRLALLPPVSGG